MNNVGVFIDSENVSYSDIPYIMMEIKNMGRIIVNRVYADWSSSYTENWKQYLVSYAMEPVHCAKLPRKNSIDIKIIDDIYDILYFKQTIDTYILISNDLDFLTVTRKIKLFGKTIIVFGYNNCSEMLKNTCDKFINITLLNLEEVKVDNDQEVVDEIDIDNVFEASANEQVEIQDIQGEKEDDGKLVRKVNDPLADAVFEIMNNERHLNISTLKHRIKKKVNVEKIEDTIKNRYKHLFRIVSIPPKKKKIYDITSINSKVHKTIDEQFLSVFQIEESDEIILPKFREKLAQQISNFDQRMWGFAGFKEMIQTLFKNKFDIVDKDNSQYIVNLN